MYDSSVVALIVAAGAGGIIGLDRTAAGQFMISEPIIAGPLTGWLLGDAGTGILIGAILELIWVLEMPVGTFVPADVTVGAVSATAIAVLGSPGSPQLDLIGFSIAVTSVLLPITLVADGFIRKQNSALADAALSVSAQGRTGAFARFHLSGLAVFFLKSFILNLVFITVGLAAVPFFVRLPQQLHTAMVLFAKALPLLGAALVLRKLSFTALDRFFLIGFAVAVLLTRLLPTHPLVAVLLIVAAGFSGARFRERRS